MTLTPLSVLLARRERVENTVHFMVTADWQQGRTTFGGLQAVMGVQAMRDVCGHGLVAADAAGGGWPLRALQVIFIGPVAVGPLSVEVQVLREGRNVCQVQARLEQGGQTVATLVGVFAASRASELPPLAAPAPPACSPQQAQAFPFLPGLTPVFARHFSIRWAEDVLPFSGTDCERACAYLQLQDSVLDAELMAVMLADVAPTPALCRLRKPAPVSSLSWSLELDPGETNAVSEGWWRVDKELHGMARGYVKETTTVRMPGGQAVAWGHQLMALYA